MEGLRKRDRRKGKKKKERGKEKEKGKSIAGGVALGKVA